MITEAINICYRHDIFIHLLLYTIYTHRHSGLTLRPAPVLNTDAIS